MTPPVTKKEITVKHAEKILSKYSEHKTPELLKALEVIRTQVSRQAVLLKEEVLKERYRTYSELLNPLLRDEDVTQKVRVEAKNVLALLERVIELRGLKKGDEEGEKKPTHLGIVPKRSYSGETANVYGIPFRELVQDPEIQQIEVQAKADETTVYEPDLDYSTSMNVFNPDATEAEKRAFADAMARASSGYGNQVEAGNTIADFLGGSDEVERSIGSEKSEEFFDLLRQGRTDEAVSLYEEEWRRRNPGAPGSPLGGYYGVAKDSVKVIVVSPETESATLYYWGVTFTCKFKGQRDKMIAALNSPTYNKGFWMAFLSVGVGYIDTVLDHNVKTSTYSGPEGARTLESSKTEGKTKWLRPNWYDKMGVMTSFAFGTRGLAIVTNVALDSRNQSISFSPITAKTGGGSGSPVIIPKVLDFKRFKVKHGYTGEQHHWDLELTVGKKVAIVGRYLILDAEATGKLIMGKLKTGGIDGKVKLATHPTRGLTITVAGVGGYDELFGPKAGGEVGIAFPLNESGTVSGDLKGFYLQYFEAEKTGFKRNIGAVLGVTVEL